MFGILDDIVDAGTSIVGDVVEITTLGTIQSKKAKDLADKGWSIYKIAQDLNTTEDAVRHVLEGK